MLQHQVYLHTDSLYWIRSGFVALALARATEREGRQLKDVDAIVGLYGAFEDLGELERHVVTTATRRWSRPPQSSPPVFRQAGSPSKPRLSDHTGFVTPKG
ncbi:hypothetical protein [Streptomyces incarnatus]|uniref:hypothetical protein n=1 Tax=Streptomyces incarnatus TaxID=665007 RepID=UPI001AD8460B|nr:hypothetical protein [Streptomyces incarnatus]